MHTLIFLIIILTSGLCYKPSNVQRGSDVTLRCDVPLLSESSSLQWIKDTGQTSNTTLLYNNSAYIILHNVNEQSEGIYYCIVMESGIVETVINHTLSVTLYSEGKKHSIYRQSSSHSDLLLIFKSKKEYKSFIWTWESKSQSKTKLIAVNKSGEVQVKGSIKLGQKTSTTYDGHVFLLHISPVQFNYDGTYRCFPNDHDSPYTNTILHTIRVSAEPSGGVLRNHSVVLTCEVSDVSDSVTLVWLRMEGNRAVLVKQQILNETKNSLISVNVNRLQSDLLDWQCAVFTDNTLRAVAPITISLISSTTDSKRISTETPTSNQEDTSTRDSSLQMVILIVCSVTVPVLILLGIVVFKRQRKTFTSGPNTVLNSGKEEEELHYASVTVAEYNQGAESWLKPNARSKVSDSSDTVIYSTIKIH